MATVTTRGGKKYTGRIRNEDNFSLQLQTLDGDVSLRGEVRSRRNRVQSANVDAG
jgi:hypothetical protein